MLRFISAFCIEHLVRYGVHSRRDALRRQHLYSKKIKNPHQMYIYQAFQRFFNQFYRFNEALNANIRSSGNRARSINAASTCIS